MNKINLSGFTNLQECLEKALPPREGEVRDYKDGKYKFTNGKWKKIKDEKKEDITAKNKTKNAKSKTEKKSLNKVERIFEHYKKHKLLEDRREYDEEDLMGENPDLTVYEAVDLYNLIQGDAKKPTKSKDKGKNDMSDFVKKFITEPKTDAKKIKVSEEDLDAYLDKYKYRHTRP